MSNKPFGALFKFPLLCIFGQFFINSCLLVRHEDLVYCELWCSFDLKNFLSIYGWGRFVSDMFSHLKKKSLCCLPLSPFVKNSTVDLSGAVLIFIVVVATPGLLCSSFTKGKIKTGKRSARAGEDMEGRKGLRTVLAVNTLTTMKTGMWLPQKNKHMKLQYDQWSYNWAYSQRKQNKISVSQRHAHTGVHLAQFTNGVKMGLPVSTN